MRKLGKAWRLTLALQKPLPTLPKEVPSPAGRSNSRMTAGASPIASLRGRGHRVPTFPVSP